MFSIKALTSIAILALPAFAVVEERATRISGATSGGISCPSGWSFYNRLNTRYCCPGIVENNGNSLDLDSSFCCVREPLEPSFSSCFPFCTETGSASSTTQQCSTTVMLTDADYNSKVNAAASSIGLTSGGVLSSSGSSGPQETGTGTTSNGAGAMMTSGPMAGAVMVAGGLLMAL